MGATAAQSTLRARGSWIETFLSVLKDTGNVTLACKKAVIDRTEVYRRRERDAEFRERWEEALEIATDKLEIVARNRAIAGVKKPIYYKGELVGHVHEPSDRLMELLLKAHRPDKYNPVQKLEHSGGVTVEIQQFGASGAAQSIVEGELVQEQSSPLSDAQSSSCEALSVDQGGDFEGGTPKAAHPVEVEASDSGIFLEKFSD